MEPGRWLLRDCCRSRSCLRTARIVNVFVGYFLSVRTTTSSSSFRSFTESSASPPASPKVSRTSGTPSPSSRLAMGARRRAAPPVVSVDLVHCLMSESLKLCCQSSVYVVDSLHLLSILHIITSTDPSQWLRACYLTPQAMVRIPANANPNPSLFCSFFLLQFVAVPNSEPWCQSSVNISPFCFMLHHLHYPSETRSQLSG